MKRKVLVVFSVILIAAFLIYINAFHGNDQDHAIYGQLSRVTGFDSNQLKGKHFVVHFWAKWCAPCTEEIPHLIAFAKNAEVKMPDLKILAVSLDETLDQSKEILPNRGQGLPSNLILLHDPKQVLSEEMGSYQFPETYFYDLNGAVIEKWVGPQKWDVPEVMDYFLGKLVTVK